MGITTITTVTLKLIEREMVQCQWTGSLVCVLCVRARSSGLLRSAVPEQGSGEGLMPSETVPPSTLTLNWHSVNPLKVHPPAAVDGPREREEEQDEDKKQKKKRSKE